MHGHRNSAIKQKKRLGTAFYAKKCLGIAPFLPAISVKHKSVPVITLATASLIILSNKKVSCSPSLPHEETIKQNERLTVWKENQWQDTFHANDAYACTTYIISA